MTITPEMVEIERAAFEAHIGNPHMLHRDTDPRGSHEYTHPYTNGGWISWLARAQSQRAVPVADDAVLIRREVYDFLMGHRDLRGQWFGDRGDHKGAFWWREELRALIDGVGGGV